MSSRLQDVLLRGLAADRPAVADVAVGTLYYSTDTAVTEQCDGSSWLTYSDAGSAPAAAITQLTGDVTAGPGPGSKVATLANTAVVAGAYTTADITVDAKGRITAAASGTSGVSSLTGDVTGTGPGATATTIANDAVTYAKMQNVSAASRLLGRGSASGSGDVQELTIGAGLSLSGTVLSNPLVISRGVAFSGTITTGFKGMVRIPFNATITRWTVMCDIAISIEFDIKVNDPLSVYLPTTSIVASAPPKLVIDNFNDDTGLSGWTVNVNAQDVMAFSVTSGSGTPGLVVLQVDMIPR